MPRIQIAAVFILIVLLACAAVYFTAANSRRPDLPKVEFRLIDGQVIDNAALNGKVVLIDFWATSCAICVAEMPATQQAWIDFKGRGFEVVAVAMPYDRPDRVLHFVKTRGVKLNIALDLSGDLVRKLGPVRGTPTRLLVSRDGQIVARIVGAISPQRLRQAVLAELDRAPIARVLSHAQRMAF